MTNEAERKVFDMVEKGQISADEGLRLIKAMGSHKEEKQEAVGIQASGFNADHSESVEYEEKDLPKIPEEELKRMARLKRWWVLPFGVGLLITTLGAIWMYMGYTANGFGFGFWLSWLPFLLGIFILALSFQSRYSVWLHVRIKQKPGETPQRIAISLPLPISLTRWVISTFGNKIPGMEGQPVEEYSEMLKSVSPEEPFYVHVDEGDGEEVEVFIG
jgi:polyhydroxyalkanoate synthesis regulator phasin